MGDEEDFDGHPVGHLYVSRQQTKAERQSELRGKFGGEGSHGVNLFVKNLDESVDEEKMKELFSPFGTVISTALPKDDKGKIKGFGFVCFSSQSEATNAVADMHLKVVNGKPLYICLAERREAREDRLRNKYS